MTVNLFTAKPGMIIGRGGKGIEDLKAEVEKAVGHPVNVNVMDVSLPIPTLSWSPRTSPSSSKSACPSAAR